MSEVPPKCVYPQSNPIGVDIKKELEAIAANRDNCTSFYLDTLERHSNNFPYREGEDHHQGLARTHKLKDGSVYFFLSHSELDEGDKGNLMQFRYSGPTDNEHIVQTSPITVAPLEQLLEIDEQHPSDIVFLPDVNNEDSGYLFVTEEFVHHRLAIYYWEPFRELKLLGHIKQGFPQGGPNFVFIDRVDDNYYLGIASNNYGWGKLFYAKCDVLFPVCEKGNMNIAAFKPVFPESFFPFPPIEGPCQIKLIRDIKNDWYLLAFRSDPPDDPNGTDYVDVYSVQFNPFIISFRYYSIHIFFKHGDTGFASTGTHYVEKSGRLLISSSYRWSKNEGPGDSGYVSRVDECASF